MGLRSSFHFVDGVLMNWSSGSSVQGWESVMRKRQGVDEDVAGVSCAEKVIGDRLPLDCYVFRCASPHIGS